MKKLALLIVSFVVLASVATWAMGSRKVDPSINNLLGNNFVLNPYKSPSSCVGYLRDYTFDHPPALILDVGTTRSGDIAATLQVYAENGELRPIPFDNIDGSAYRPDEDFNAAEKIMHHKIITVWSRSSQTLYTRTTGRNAKIITSLAFKDKYTRIYSGTLFNNRAYGCVFEKPKP